jgi:hypothetical protein
METEFPARMDRKLAAAFLGLSTATLSQDVVTRRHKIPVAKIGRRCVYDRALLESWLRARTVNVPAETVCA